MKTAAFHSVIDLLRPVCAAEQQLTQKAAHVSHFNSLLIVCSQSVGRMHGYRFIQQHKCFL